MLVRKIFFGGLGFFLLGTGLLTTWVATHQPSSYPAEAFWVLVAAAALDIVAGAFALFWARRH